MQQKFLDVRYIVPSPNISLTTIVQEYGSLEFIGPLVLHSSGEFVPEEQIVLIIGSWNRRFQLTAKKEDRSQSLFGNIVHYPINFNIFSDGLRRFLVLENECSNNVKFSVSVITYRGSKLDWRP
jgi:hypothetical protein